MADNHVLFLSYTGILEPLIHSQGLPYIRGLLKCDVGRFTLLTFEKKENFNKCGIQYIETLGYELRKEGIEWHFLYYHKKPVLLAKLFDISNALIYSIFFVIFKRIKLIHARGIVSASIAFGLHLIFGVRFIFDMRNFLAEAYVSAGIWKINSLNFKLVKFMERLILRSASVTIVESSHHYQILKKDKYINNNVEVEVIPCCVDLKKFQYRAKKDIKLIREFGLDSHFCLIYIGSLGTWYMLEEMLDFFKTMSKDIDFIDSDFILTTTYRRDLIIEKAQRKEIDIEKIKILSLPYIKMPDILSLSNLGIAFIKPYERMDSFPTKIGEYLALGLPIILNKGMGDAEEIVRENKLGIVIEEFSAEGYKNGLCKLKELLKEGETLNIRCREFAERYLSLEKGVEKYHNIYSRILN